MTEQLFNAERCYRPDEIATKLNVDISTVYRMIRDIDDPLPAFRPDGKRLRVHGAEMNTYLDRHRVNPMEE